MPSNSGPPSGHQTAPSAPGGQSLDPQGGRRDTDAVVLRLSCPDFIGRADEWQHLETALERVGTGQAATILISGDAGIGKTRLVEEFARTAVASGALVATGACIPVDGDGLPYAPVAGILRDIAHQLGSERAAEILGPLASGLGLGIGQPGLSHPTDSYSAVPRIVDELAKTRLFESILSGVVRLADQSSVILVFEDLQWADSASASLLSFLIRNLTDTRVLLIGTYRSEDVGPDHQLRTWLTELSRHVRVTQLGLQGLARAETGQLIEGILGHLPDWALVEAVWARSQGNAFFAEELTASRHSPSLSPELRGVIMTRVEALSNEAQELLRVATTIGTTVDHQLLVGVGVMDADALDRVLGETVDKQVLVVDPARAGYRFRHGLVREAMYDALLPGERQRLHHLVAITLDADPLLGFPEPAHRAAELAAHWWAAGDWAEALAASMLAANAAADGWAFPEALTQLERALSALDHLEASAVPTGVDRLRLLESAADAAYLAGEGKPAVDLALAAIATVDSEVDPSTAARCYALLGRNAWAIGDSDGAFDAYRRAATLVPADPPSVTLARVLAEEARGLMLMSRIADSELRCHEAMAAAVAVGARAEEGHIRYTLGCCRASLGFYDEGIALISEALEIAEALGSADDLNRAFMGLSGVLIEAGQLEEGAALVFDSAAKGEELWGVRLNGAAGNGVEALIRLGRHDDAEALLALTNDRGVGACTGGPILRATLEIRCGRFDEAIHDLAITDELSHGLNDLQHRGSFHMECAELALLQSRPEDAYESIERVLALAATTDDELYRPEFYALGARTLADIAEDARLTGRRFDVDKARLLVDGFVQESDRLVAAPGERGGRCAPRPRAMAAMCTAEQSRLYDSDPELWGEATRRWEDAGEPYPAAYCRWREAEALLERRTGRSRASECLQHAWRVTVDLHARPLRERIERLAQRARIPLVDVDDTEVVNGSTLAGDLGLTPREVEVLGQLAAGRRDGEIAESLFISKKTVSVHVSNVLRKLDVPNRVEAGRIGQAQGLG